jgi:hypothetical protein
MGITFLIIVLNHRAVISFCKERSHPLEIWKPGKWVETGKNDEEAESAHPENGQCLDRLDNQTKGT